MDGSRIATAEVSTPSCLHAPTRPWPDTIPAGDTGGWGSWHVSQEFLYGPPSSTPPPLIFVRAPSGARGPKGPRGVFGKRSRRKTIHEAMKSLSLSLSLALTLSSNSVPRGSARAPVLTRFLPHQILSQPLNPRSTNSPPSHRR